MEWLSNNWEHIALAVTTLIALAAHAAALTPGQKDDQAVGIFKKMWDIIAGNYGNAKNKP